MADMDFDKAYHCVFCDLTWPHHHDHFTAPDGSRAEAVVYWSRDENAEVRDPDTGEVIFRATKVPLRVVGGTGA